MIEGMEGLDHEEHLDKLGMFTLERRRLSGDTIAVFKILKGLDDESMTKYNCLYLEKKLLAKGYFDQVQSVLTIFKNFRGSPKCNLSCLHTAEVSETEPSTESSHNTSDPILDHSNATCDFVNCLSHIEHHENSSTNQQFAEVLEEIKIPLICLAIVPVAGILFGISLWKRNQRIKRQQRSQNEESIENGKNNEQQSMLHLEGNRNAEV
ncbi:uncharacterized protein LOC102364515 [Latimeria chalumnae]|uniref:uncharacterized protein LOC102364515 n=1 Tax=Latimeria chalumnae TaxID=7897 RepID=UPI00313D5A1F